MAKKNKGPEKDNSERWLLTYSDLMNLLLILFIILYCSSKIDAKKAEAVANSMHEGFGYTQGDGTGSGGSGGSDGSGGSGGSGGSAAADSSASPSATVAPSGGAVAKLQRLRRRSPQADRQIHLKK